MNIPQLVPFLPLPQVFGDPLTVKIYSMPAEIGGMAVGQWRR